MSIRYRVDRVRGLLITFVTGRVSVEEVVRYLDQIVADPETDECDELVIVRDADLKEISSEGVRRIARHASKVTTRDDFRTAVVAPSDAEFGLLRMFEAFRERAEGNFGVFRDLESARVWLRVDALPEWANE